MSQLTSDWNNEAYVSLHLVQPLLQLIGLPAKSGYSHWIPEFKIKVPKLLPSGQITETVQEADFLIESELLSKTLDHCSIK